MNAPRRNPTPGATWYAHAPGMVYAINVTARNEAEARAKLRAFLGCNKLPPGCAAWEANA